MVPLFDWVNMAFDVADVALRVSPIVRNSLQGKMPNKDDMVAAKSAFAHLAADLKTDADETFFDSIHAQLRSEKSDLADNIDKLFVSHNDPHNPGFTPHEREALTGAVYTLFVLKDKKPEGEKACVQFLTRLAQEEEVPDMRLWLKGRGYLKKAEAKQKRSETAAEIEAKLKQWAQLVKDEGPGWLKEAGLAIGTPTHEAISKLDKWLVTSNAEGKSPMDWLEKFAK